MIGKISLLGTCVGACALCFLCTPALADDWLSTPPQPPNELPGVKICVIQALGGLNPATGENTRTWTAAFPVTKNWAFADCGNVAKTMKADRIKLGCFFPPLPSGVPPLPVAFACPGTVEGKLAGDPACLTPFIPQYDCGWSSSSTENKPNSTDTKLSETKVPPGPKPPLDDEWAADSTKRVVKQCRFSGAGWSTILPVTNNIAATDCEKMARNKSIPASTTLQIGCLLFAADGNDGTYSWSKPVGADALGRGWEPLTLPAPNCGWRIGASN